jgi:hypothetical protein
MAHIFLSYHHVDIDFAYALSAALETAGFAVWINPDPAAGEAWDTWIETGYRGTFVLITLQSPEAAASPVLAAEWAYAWGASIPVIPVRTGGVELHPYLDALLPVTGDWDSVLVRVVERVRRVASDVCAGLVFAPFDAAPEVFTAARVLSHFDAGLRAEAVARLGEIEFPEARAALRAALTHPVYADVRRMAAHTLSQIGDRDAIPDLVALLSDPNDTVSRAAIDALVQIGTPAIAMLVVALDDPHRLRRRAAILALVEIGGPEAVPGLIAALQVPDWHVSRTAAVALGRSGDTRAVLPLIATLDSDDEHLCDLAAAALERIGTPEAFVAVERWQRRR